MGQPLSMNLGLSQLPESRDSKDFLELTKIYNAIKGLAGVVDSYTGALTADSSVWSTITPQETIVLQNSSRLYVKFSENVGVGQFVNLYNAAGVMTARKADGALFYLCHAYSTGTVTAGNYGEVILNGMDAYVAGITPGAPYYLSASTPGAITSVAPVAPYQIVGFGLSTTSLFFKPELRFS